MPDAYEERIGYSADALIGRAVAHPIRDPHVERVRWSLVGETFSVGSTTAGALCRMHGQDPDEMLPPSGCKFAEMLEDGHA